MRPRPGASDKFLLPSPAILLQEHFQYGAGGAYFSFRICGDTDHIFVIPPSCHTPSGRFSSAVRNCLPAITTSNRNTEVIAVTPPGAASSQYDTKSPDKISMKLNTTDHCSVRRNLLQLQCRRYGQGNERTDDQDADDADRNRNSRSYEDSKNIIDGLAADACNVSPVFIKGNS